MYPRLLDSWQRAILDGDGDFVRWSSRGFSWECEKRVPSSSRRRKALPAIQPRAMPPKSAKVRSKPAEPPAESPEVTPDTVREMEQRVRTDRKHANELLELLELLEQDATPATVRLAAMQACRSVFETWAVAGELELQEVDAEESTAVASALAAYRAWLLRAYRRFGVCLRAVLAASKPALALRLAALDSLMVLAALEARHARPGKVHVESLDSAAGAFRHAIEGLLACKRAPPDELLDRLGDTHLMHLDTSYYLLRHVRRLAGRTPASTRPRAERLLPLLQLVTPPDRDISPRDASMLVATPPPPPGAPTASASAVLLGANHASNAPAHTKVKATGGSWPADLRQLLTKKAHRTVRPPPLSRTRGETASLKPLLLHASSAHPAAHRLSRRNRRTARRGVPSFRCHSPKPSSAPSYASCPSVSSRTSLGLSSTATYSPTGTQRAAPTPCSPSPAFSSS